VLDNLPDGQTSAGAVETAEMAKATTSTELEQSADQVAELASLSAAVTTAPPTTAPTTTAPPTTTTPPTTAPPTTAAPTTAPPATAPPTTAPPTTLAPPPPPPSGSAVEAMIRSAFGAQGANAVAVARCESGLNVTAYNPAGPYYGLFQIGGHHAANFQAVTGVSLAQGGRQAGPNVQYAKWLYDRSGWGQWGCRYVVQ
jgi:Transglycosylase-like domain